MRFDVARFYSEPPVYCKMSEKELAFHDALGRGISVGENIRYVRIPRFKTNNGRSRSRCISVGIEISPDTGKIKATLWHRHKTEKAMVRLEDIQSCFDDIVHFFEVCTDYKYLIGEEDKRV